MIYNYKCNWCNKEFTTSKKKKYQHTFCSLSCSVSYKNTKNKKGINKDCECCGKSIWVIDYRLNKFKHHFCSSECQYKWNRGGNNSRYQGGYDSRYGKGWKRQRELTIKRDKICKNCGANTNIDIHHIVPFQLSKDNSLSNLIALCKSCHSSIGNTYWKLDNRPKYFEKINSMRINI